MTSRRMQILLLALFAASAVPTLSAQAPAPSTQTPVTAAGPRMRDEWRRFEPQLPRDRSTADAATLPRKQTITVETWVIIVAAVVLIIILV